MDTEVNVNNKLDILIPKDVMNQINTKIFKELLMSILIFIYYVIIYTIFQKINNTIFTYYLNICTCICSVSAIVLFEIGYRNDNERLFIRGIEIMALGLITLFMPYVFLKRGKTFISLYALSCLYISVYYSIKALVVYISEIRKYRRGLSDIKEILASKKESYLEIKNERKFKNVDDEKSSKWRRAIILKSQFNKNKKIKEEKNSENKANDEILDKPSIKKEPKSKTTKKRGRKPTGKKVVKSMATARKKKKEDEE